MSEILEIRENISHDVPKIKDIPHYPKFEVIIDELTHKQIIEYAKTGYNSIVEFQGGVIDE